MLRNLPDYVSRVSIGVLLRAKNDGQLERTQPELQALRTRSRFFVSAHLQEEVLKVAGELL
jgi:predicted nucleic acid-binding protein